ncbi:MAG TPA: 50S ribosomal protein L25 [Candidatus Limnocylindria bacterium]|nr:50S ribosomal protein L25 [Candidatus Limnocylindria bacterium]
METVDITVERRTGRGKGAARRLRATGRVPAIIYGPKRQALAVSISAAEFSRKMAHLEGTHLVRLLSADNDPDLHDRVVLVREAQEHPVTGMLLHADFYEVDLTARIEVAVPLHFVGRAAGVVLGGILQPVMRELPAECLPTEIPEYIEVDVTPLGIHEAIHVRDLRLPEGVRAKAEPGQTVVTVIAPTVEEAPAAAAAAVEAVPGEAAPAEAAAAKKPEGEA